MKSTLNQPKRRISTAIWCVVAAALLLTGCSTPPRIQSDNIPTGSLRLAQVVFIFSQRQINETKGLPELLTSSGLSETEIRDGSVVVGRVECCGGPNEQTSATWLYVPTGIQVEPGDIVESRVGHVPKNGKLGELNTVTQVRQHASDEHGSIYWDPPNERLWRRILYADWMPKEGWVHHFGIWSSWYLPPPKEKS